MPPGRLYRWECLSRLHPITGPHLRPEQGSLSRHGSRLFHCPTLSDSPASETTYLIVYFWTALRERLLLSHLVALVTSCFVVRSMPEIWPTDTAAERRMAGPASPDAGPDDSQVPLLPTGWIAQWDARCVLGLLLVSHLSSPPLFHTQASRFPSLGSADCLLD